MTSEAKVRELDALLQMTFGVLDQCRQRAKEARLAYLHEPDLETRAAAVEAAEALLDAELLQVTIEHAYYEAREEAGLDD